MDMNTIYIVASVPISIMLYVVYEMVKMGSERKG